MNRYRVISPQPSGMLSRYAIGDVIETENVLELYEREGWVEVLNTVVMVDKPSGTPVPVQVQDVVHEVTAT